MPLALFGLISSLVLWDVFRCYGNHWGLDEYPVLKQALFFIMQVGMDTISIVYEAKPVTRLQGKLLWLFFNFL